MLELLTNDQIVLSFTILILLGLFIWNKYRYDAISIAALVFLVAISSIPNLELNIISTDDALDGFANPAVMTVALVLIISHGLKNAGLSALAGKIVGGISAIMCAQNGAKCTIVGYDGINNVLN